MENSPVLFPAPTMVGVGSNGLLKELPRPLSEPLWVTPETSFLCIVLCVHLVIHSLDFTGDCPVIMWNKSDLFIYILIKYDPYSIDILISLDN